MSCDVLPPSCLLLLDSGAGRRQAACETTTSCLRDFFVCGYLFSDWILTITLCDTGLWLSLTSSPPSYACICRDVYRICTRTQTLVRLAGGKGREGQPGHHLIRITMIPHSQPWPPKHPKALRSDGGREAVLRILPSFMDHRSIMRQRSSFHRGRPHQ